MAKKKNTDVPVIKVYDFEIKIGAIYKVVNRPDKSAPDGFREKGSTKLPSYGIGNYNGVNYISHPLTNKGVYDTGLYVDSPCYALVDKEEARLRVNAIEKYLVEPYERSIGQKGVLEHSNLEFWDDYRYQLTVDRAFRTDDPQDLMDLFQAILAFRLVPKEEVGNPKFRIAQYIVEDVTKVKGYKEELNDALFMAIANFSRLLESDRYLALRTLEYVGFNKISDEIESVSLNSLVMSWLMASNDNVVKFSGAYAKAIDKNKSNEILIFEAINKLLRTGKVLNMSGEYFYGDVSLGVDLKMACANVNSNPDLEDIKDQLLTV